jgi:secondary thiamine-phosphate synthase enzyme
MARVKVFQGERRLRTEGGLSVRDITGDVAEAVHESGVRDGIACVYSPHTTCCVRVNEFEDGFLEDFAALLRRLVPTERYYAHDDWDRRTENICEEDMELGNGHAHCMSMLLGSAGESIPVRDGELCLGTWQRVLFLELDRERDRRWLVQVVGS